MVNSIVGFTFNISLLLSFVLSNCKLLSPIESRELRGIVSSGYSPSISSGGSSSGGYSGGASAGLLNYSSLANYSVPGMAITSNGTGLTSISSYSTPNGYTVTYEGFYNLQYGTYYSYSTSSGGPAVMSTTTIIILAVAPPVVFFLVVFLTICCCTKVIYRDGRRYRVCKYCCNQNYQQHLRRNDVIIIQNNSTVPYTEEVSGYSSTHQGFVQ